MFGQFAVNEDPLLVNTRNDQRKIKEAHGGKGIKIVELLSSPTTRKAMTQEKIHIYAAWKWTTTETDQQHWLKFSFWGFY